MDELGEFGLDEPDPGESNADVPGLEDLAPGEPDHQEPDPGKADPGESNPDLPDLEESDPGESNPSSPDKGESDREDSNVGEADPDTPDRGEPVVGSSGLAESEGWKADRMDSCSGTSEMLLVSMGAPTWRSATGRGRSSSDVLRVDASGGWRTGAAMSGSPKPNGRRHRDASAVLRSMPTSSQVSPPPCDNGAPGLSTAFRSEDAEPSASRASAPTRTSAGTPPPGASPGCALSVACRANAPPPRVGTVTVSVKGRA
ncbi:hypothetical protein ACTMTF_34535 [Nonomuraea sp. ZG12]|uniref:hypothetical protein n=1 Tax=Nonomuraea sp. ZG12 TaxID=3452207 RepID=UPI003F8B22E6